MAKKKLEEPEPIAEAPAEPGEFEAPAAEEKVARKAAKGPSRKRARSRKAVADEPKKERKRPKPIGRNEVHVYNLDGDVVKNVELPPIFEAPLRPDLIRRAVTAFQANRRQPYGPNPKAGQRHSVRWSGKGHGVSRVPRIRGTMIGAQAPGTVGGRRAHPPRPWADYSKKVNEKERRSARAAALAALRHAELVANRGHRFEDGPTLPIIVTDDFEELGEKAGAARGAEVLQALRVWSDVERAANGTHIRAGRGKMRGRRYREPKSLLVVTANPKSVSRCFRNFPGVDVVHPSQLNAEVLAPGGEPGRLAIFTESALEALRGWPR